MPRSTIDVMALLEAQARLPKVSGPVTLSPGYIRALERWEAQPEQAEGADKSWALRADRSARETAARARLLE